MQNNESNISWTDNILVDFLLLIYNMLMDHILFVAILIIAFFTVYALRNIIFSILHKIEKIYRKFPALIRKINTDAAIKNHVRMHQKKKQVLIDTEKSIKNLSNPEKKFVSLQYLFNYPSSKAFQAILAVALSEQDKDIRIELICSMCSAARQNKWWEFR